MRDLLAEIEEHDDRRARLAVDVFCYRARVRTRILEGLEWMGLELDDEANARTNGGETGAITRAGTRLAAWVIPTDEELLIARDTHRLVAGHA